MEQKNSILNGFNRAAKGILWLATSYVLPWDFKRLAAAMALWSAIQTAGPFLFPTTTEAWLEKEGIDPAVMPRLTDHPSHVIERTPKGKLFFTYSDPLLPRQIENFSLYMTPGNANAFPLRGNILSWIGLNKDVHLILPPIKYTDAKQVFANCSHLPYDAIERLDITAKDHFTYVILHEIRHTSSGNKEGEADADEQAIRTFITAMNGNPALLKTAVDCRILSNVLSVWNSGLKESDDAESYSTTHNVALYLDARFRGETPPAPEEIARASHEAAWKMKPFLTADDKREKFIRYTEALRRLLKEDATLSPFARCVAELFVEAVEYRAPSSVGGQTVYPPVTNPQTHASPPPRPDA